MQDYQTNGLMLQLKNLFENIFNDPLKKFTFLLGKKVLLTEQQIIVEKQKHAI